MILQCFSRTGWEWLISIACSIASGSLGGPGGSKIGGPGSSAGVARTAVQSPFVVFYPTGFFFFTPTVPFHRGPPEIRLDCETKTRSPKKPPSFQISSFQVFVI